MDFVTKLPVAEGNTVILTVVYCFSKMTHFIPLPKLSSAKETAEIILAQVVRIHGLPVDIVSDRGPQFVSHFWKAWEDRPLGETVCLLDTILNRMNSQRE